ncbi:hypothetical protein PENTCL1PPCAC_9942, partial [Pristionchus entomophagus]
IEMDTFVEGTLSFLCDLPWVEFIRPLFFSVFALFFSVWAVFAAFNCMCMNACGEEFLKRGDISQEERDIEISKEKNIAWKILSCHILITLSYFLLGNLPISFYNAVLDVAFSLKFLQNRWENFSFFWTFAALWELGEMLFGVFFTGISA